MAASKKPLLVTIPHSGERVPQETPWLNAHPETLLMFDVDRFVDQLYEPAIRKLGLPSVKAEWHRYAIDLNRARTDIDSESVVGEAAPAGKFPRGRGLHWSMTTKGERLMPEAMRKETHDSLIKNYFEPFHRDVVTNLKALRERGAEVTYHVDLHSMPSVGTSEHRDPGEYRKDIVVSDVDGKSCSPAFKDLVISAYEKAGFAVAYNWPYKGGQVTVDYGRPADKQEAIQVELNRSLYMNETTKKLDAARLADIQKRLSQALQTIHDALPDLPR